MITINDYIKRLQELRDKYPNAVLISASDEEGNSFTKVVYSPTAGKYTDDGDFEPITENGEEEEVTSDDVNAICVN